PLAPARPQPGGGCRSYPASVAGSSARRRGRADLAGARGTARAEAPAATSHTTLHDDQPSTIGISSGVRNPVANTVVFSRPKAVPARAAPAMEAISVYATPCHALASTPPAARTAATRSVGAWTSAAAP